MHENLETLRCLFDHAVKHPKETHWTQHLGWTGSIDNSKLIQLVCSALKQCGIVDENGNGQTLLQCAVEIGNNEMVRQLIFHGAELEVSDNWGWMPLHVASFHGHEDVVRTLLEAGANVCAATTNWNEKRALMSGARELQGWTGHPLHIAALMGRIAVVKLLLVNGTDVNASTGVGHSEDPGHGPTALYIALDPFVWGERGEALDDDRLGIARILVENGAEVQGAGDHFYLSDVLRF